jgi:hypothetical protein
LSIFQDLKLEWDGKSYQIPARKMMETIAGVEEHITLKELFTAASQRGTIQLVRLARAWATVLQSAGAKVSDEEVYSGMFGAKGAGQQAVQDAITHLLMMMIPPDKLKEWQNAAEEAEVSEQAEGEAGGQTEAAVSLSELRIKRREAGG